MIELRGWLIYGDYPYWWMAAMLDVPDLNCDQLVEMAA